jgi:UDP-N-acetylglucosamine acyltransferase
MATTIHPTAIVDPSAKLGEDVSVGPFTIVEGKSTVGDGCQIGSNALIGENTIIGKECKIFHGAVIGSIAQDLKYKGEEAWLEIGDNNIFREYCTINRGTIANGKTVIGNNCAFLAYCHVGHDCIIGDNIIASNTLNLAGHVIIGNDVGFGGVVAVHQFCKIGDHAYLGAYSKVVKDVIPYALLGGEVNSAKIVGINKVGLERKGFDDGRRRKIINAYKTLFNTDLTVQEAVEKINTEFTDDKDIMKIIDFIADSERGIYRMDI